ncbi:CmcI family methyltransferase [Frankia sp. CiP3]|uniref:CmcI family methyltransferase n=1 Tax=Frankia sp. CiP3 TaxID=2880971 RepID=UPI001EF4AB6F|nr:CmcI family methyltransferase [Frankia sp. CiP3]
MTRSARETDNGRAWVTMVTNDEYVDGVVVLAYSLLTVNSRHHLLVMLTPTVSVEARRRIAALDNCHTAEIKPILPAPVKLIDYAFPYLVDSWTKLAMWNFEEYDRLVWLDADMLVLHNMDELFDVPIDTGTIAAAPQRLCNALHFDNFPAYFRVEHCPYHGRSQQLRRFNAGLLVATPSTAMYKELTGAIHKREINQMHFAEQDLLNEYFADSWHALDYVYNATKGISRAHPELWNLDVIKNLHYVGQKPWNCDMAKARANDDPMYRINKVWWDMREEAFTRLSGGSAAKVDDTTRRAMEKYARQPPPPPLYLEEALDVPLRQILPRLQQRFLTQTSYFGVPAWKNPLDLWVYQELLYEQAPDVIIEIGNRFGGSTLALAHLCDLMDNGRVIAVDLSHESVPRRVREHPRITWVEGDACELFDQVESLLDPQARVVVIEDSAHTYDNTLTVLRLYSQLVKPGGFFVVEDGILGHGLDMGPRPGPYEAVETFVAEHPDFVIERERESLLLTWCPKGFLRRIR